MNEWYIIFVFAALGTLAAALILYPLKSHRLKAAFILLPLILLFVLFAYQQWGAWSSWQTYLAQQQKQQEIKRVLAQIKSPDELIERLKSRLDDSPASARGWYLLGRLYVSQNNWQLAYQAFSKSCHLNPADESARINLIEAQWQLNDQKFDKSIRHELHQLLQKNPDQADSLALLAMDAYQRNNYLKAIGYWQHLLRLAPEDSPEAKALRKAIAKAQQKQEAKLPADGAE